ncbi:MAG: DUF2752 domain-containing protein [Clostridia bacterium]|nr:DUF2752 domain-containing protein [Clostridia bacterium]
MNKNIIKRHIICFTVICLFFGITALFDIGCPVLYITGIPCPACGVTRAMLSLVRFDIASYLFYNPMALPLCIAAALMLHLRVVKRNMPIVIYSVAVAVINFVIYIFKFI